MSYNWWHKGATMKKGKKMSEYSRICHHFSIKNDRPSRYTINRIIDRLGAECAICGNNDEVVIELHHIIPLAIGGKNDINNFVCLCANHHKKVHSKLENVQVM